MNYKYYFWIVRCGFFSFLMAQSVVSERGKRKIVHENHVYVFSNRTKDELDGIWVCEKRSYCNGRV